MEKEKVVIGIDIGGTNTVLGVVDRSGRILAEELHHHQSLRRA